VWAEPDADTPGHSYCWRFRVKQRGPSSMRTVIHKLDLCWMCCLDGPVTTNDKGPETHCFRAF